MTDVKEERVDPYEMVIIKTEPDILSSLTQDNDSLSTIPHTFKMEHDNQFETIEYKVPKLKLEQHSHSQIGHGSVRENVPMFPAPIIKEFVTVTDDIKQEVSDYVQPKIESELLTSDCDLPTLKDENTDYADYIQIQSCSSKPTENILKPLKNNANVVSKKKRRYPCLVCQKNFNSSKSRSTHIDEHFRKCSVVCNFCGKSMTKSEYVRHCFIHVVKKRTRKLYQKFVDISSLQPHVIIHDDESPFKCNVCLKEFKFKSHLQNHLIIHGNDSPFKCKICSKECNQKHNLKQHLLIHSNEKPFKCEICSKNFSRPCSLRQHLIVHTTEKPFKCDICSKGFTRNFTLKQHLIIHTSERLFKCHICSTKFTQKWNLHQHLLTHTEEKPYKCDTCLAQFTQRWNLAQHILIHASEKPFKCDVCSKGFTRIFSLKQHYLIMHTDEEKLFKCDICLKQFKSNIYLKKHLIIHTNDKPFKCFICSKEFKANVYLKRHLKIHSNNENLLK